MALEYDEEIEFLRIFYDEPYQAYDEEDGGPDAKREESADGCNSYYKTEAFSIPVFSVAVNALLVLRLHALFNKRSVTVVLVALLVVQQTIAWVITTQAALSAHALQVPPEVRAWPGCFSERLDRTPRYTTTAWAAALVLDSVFFAMTLYKLWEMRVQGVEMTGIIVIFARDGAMFYGMIFALELANTVIIAAEPLEPLIGAGSSWIIAGWAIACSRLVLNLREFGGNESMSSAKSRADFTGSTATGIELEFRNPSPTLTSDNGGTERGCVQEV
ncbi:hypothetical protein EXIGLDRAFT_831180 [Exidia glandulosa HHB12029]|uniref:Integral membrane protein n=1 Tax=Exidia glandulosa HHB12029 TaxID=1314781 RepID=A0A166BC13_EXIGL|nr:hypothetical protein EXIGLDRAFT_831180 [Exidia glandulosa HHB12029]